MSVRVHTNAAGVVGRQRPVLGLDLDGTIADYHGHFLRFAEGWLGKELSYDYDIRVPMYRHMGVSKERYRQCKLAYRMGGLKRSMPALPWARSLVREVRSWRVDIWVCTTRPYLSHDNVDSDTRHWLRRNGISCQGVIWGEHKYRELVRTVGKSRIFAVLDDLPEMLDQATSLDLPAVLAVRPHNRKFAWQQFKYLTAAGDLDTASRLHDLLDEWREIQ